MINLLDKALSIDTLIFIFTTLIFIILINKKKVNFYSKLAICLLFLAFNSSYNIMVKRVHDFNIQIPRNFIWNFDVISSFSLFDLIFILLMILGIPSILKVIQDDFLVRITFIRDISIIIIGTISYVLFEGYWLDGGKNYILTIKGLVYFCGALFLTIKYLNFEFSLKDYLLPISLILFNGLFSLQFFPTQEIWVRYGQRIKILDQEDAYTISLFIITLLIIYVSFSNIKNNKKIYYTTIFFLIAFFLQNALSIYKTNFVYYVYVLMIIPFLGITKRQFIKWYSLLTIIMIITILGAGIVINISTSQSIMTRSSQIEDYFSYINSQFPGAHLIGSGIGTPYYSVSETNDLGEVKIIDKENSMNSNYKFTFQIPILFIYKYSGILGIILFLLFWIIILLKMFKEFKVVKNSNMSDFSKSEYYSIAIYLTFFSILWGSVMLGGTTPFFIFLGFIIGRLYYLRKKLITP